MGVSLWATPTLHVFAARWPRMEKANSAASEECEVRIIHVYMYQTLRNVSDGSATSDHGNREQRETGHWCFPVGHTYPSRAADGGDVLEKANSVDSGECATAIYMSKCN